MPRRIPTGNVEADARDDFDQARQRQALSRIGRWLRRQPGDVDTILPFDEVVSALGRTGERDLGLQPIRLDSIAGTVDRVGGGFDRSFRPTSAKDRERWVRSAAAMRRGEPLEPISVYRVGDVHFVRDGHHRVSVATGRRPRRHRRLHHRDPHQGRGAGRPAADGPAAQVPRARASSSGCR